MKEQYSWQPCLVTTNCMVKPGKAAENSGDTTQVIDTLERECEICQGVMRNNLDKKTVYWVARRIR